jgi:glutathione S-transferase
MFAALSTAEPPIVDRDIVTFAERGKSWREERMRMVEDRIRVRLGELSARLGDADWLNGTFSAADLLMVHVLQRLKGSGLLDEFPNLSANVARAEARPAYKRAFAAQLAVFTGKPPTGG